MTSRVAHARDPLAKRHWIDGLARNISCETVENVYFRNFMVCNLLILLLAEWPKTQISDLFDRLYMNGKRLITPHRPSHTSGIIKENGSSETKHLDNYLQVGETPPVGRV